MSKDSSAKYYRDKKERRQKQASEKKRQYGCEQYKNPQKMENKSYLSVEKILQNEKKRITVICMKFVFFDNYKKLFSFQKCVFFG